jgi:hypothetical protein
MISRARVVALLAALAACGDDPDPERLPGVDVALLPTAVNRDLDLLFVIDDSINFYATQSAFADAFPAFLDELATMEGGLPDLHIGVVTPDLGTLGARDTTPGPAVGSGPGSCVGAGKEGMLQTSDGISDVFIRDVALGDGTRSTNYTGSLAEAMRSLALVGSSGCGFEQHLEAARRALDSHPANAGFRRPDARLAVIVVTDEDDCSFAHSAFIGPESAELGPQSSFRCTRFGITCDDGGRDLDEMNQPGRKNGCHSNEDSPHIVPLGEYASFFQGLVSDPRDVLVGTLTGGAERIEVVSPGGGPTQRSLMNACLALDAIMPAIRIPELARMFPRHVVENLCADDYRPAQESFARHVRNLVGDTCIPRALPPAASCVAIDQRADGSETALPACDGPASTDCYELVADDGCTASQLRVDVRRSAAPPADVMVAVRCQL